MKKITVADKLTQLRELMRNENIDYYYVPAADAHHNEYLPACWQRRAWISDFTGSAGDVLIAADAAYLWTDPRYFLQARQELNLDYYQLMAYAQGMAPPIDIWLQQNTHQQRIGVDPKLISIAQAKKWQQALQKTESKLISIEQNLIDQIWQGQPELPHSQLKILETQYAGIDLNSKIANLRKALQQKQADAEVITILDAIAWLFNIRGNDIDFNPLTIGYAVIDQEKAILCLNNSSALTNEQRHYFQSAGIELLPYQQFVAVLQQLNGKILLDPQQTSWWVQQQLEHTTTISEPSPITMMKACKNPVEIKGMHEAHRRDAIAMIKFLYWLDNSWQKQTEMSAAKKLKAFRLEDPDCQGLSFATISGYAEHGAIIHYRVNKATDKPLGADSLYLIDSGGQYWQGTTDITRTIHLGTPTEQQKHYYTLVLKGHLALRHTIFPQGTYGEHLNAIAHHPLWQHGLDFSHGTGHGVGCFLCVHEGPQRISSAQTGVPLKENMVVSNEPGLYFENQYGIRIENLCVIREKISKKNSLSGHGPFLGFEDLTMVPYASKLIHVPALTADELQWVNDYHQQIYQLLKDDLPEEAGKWLQQATLPLS